MRNHNGHMEAHHGVSRSTCLSHVALTYLRPACAHRCAAYACDAGMSLGNASGWLLALISLFFYPLISAAVGGPAPQFAFFGVVVALLFALLVWQLPETNGITFDGHRRDSVKG
jgi:hypothetical protein